MYILSENMTSFHMSRALLKNRPGLLTFGNNAQTDVCLQGAARGDENVAASFCLLLGAAVISHRAAGESIAGAFPNALQCKVSLLTQTTPATCWAKRDDFVLKWMKSSPVKHFASSPLKGHSIWNWSLQSECASVIWRESLPFFKKSVRMKK